MNAIRLLYLDQINKVSRINSLATKLLIIYIFINLIQIKQSVPKKGDRSNPSSYCPIALISCLSKAFETILNRKFLKHLSSFNLLSDHQYGFRKGRSSVDLLAFLTDSWSSSLSRFDKTFAVA